MCHIGFKHKNTLRFLLWAQKKKILLVDDEPDITLLISALLEFHDHSTTTLNDPTLVLETLQKELFDLLCTDIMMPNLDGVELIRKIRNDKKIKNMKIIALSAKEFSKEEYQSLLDNQVLLIKKPYDPRELVSKINQVLNV